MVNNGRFCCTETETYSYLIDDSDENKKGKGTKNCVVKRKLKFEDYKHCLQATELENKINHVEKNNLNVDNLQKNHKRFIKNNKLI